MKTVNKFHPLSLATRARSFGTKFGAVCAAAMVPAMAMASTTIGAAAATELASANTVIKGLLITLVGVVFLFVVYSLIKRAK